MESRSDLFPIWFHRFWQLKKISSSNPIYSVTQRPISFQLSKESSVLLHRTGTLLSRHLVFVRGFHIIFSGAHTAAVYNGNRSGFGLEIGFKEKKNNNKKPKKKTTTNKTNKTERKKNSRWAVKLKSDQNISYHICA